MSLAGWRAAALRDGFDRKRSESLSQKKQYPREDSNLQPLAPEAAVHYRGRRESILFSESNAASAGFNPLHRFRVFPAVIAKKW